MALGMAAFGATTFVFGSDLADWGAVTSSVPASAAASYVSTGSMILVFGGIAQFIAAMWAFRRASTFWAAFLGVFGSLYLALSLGLTLVGADNLPIGVFGPDIPDGTAVAMFAFIAAYLTWAAAGVNRASVVMSALLAVSLALLSGAFFMQAGTGKLWVFWASGYAAIVSGLIAFYISAAVVVNSALRRQVLP